MSVDGLILRYGRTVTIGARSSSASTTSGAVVVTYTNTTTAVAWLQPLSAREAEMYGCERGRMAYRGFAPAGTSISNSDRVTATIDSESRTFDVLGVEKPGEMASGPLKRVEFTLQETKL